MSFHKTLCQLFFLTVLSITSTSCNKESNEIKPFTDEVIFSGTLRRSTEHYNFGCQDDIVNTSTEAEEWEHEIYFFDSQVPHHLLYTATSDSEGHYCIPLKSGEYTVFFLEDFSAQGYHWSYNKVNIDVIKAKYMEQDIEAIYTSSSSSPCIIWHDPITIHSLVK